VTTARVYCTYFDVHYLPRGLALWRSLRAVSVSVELWVCCLDAASEDALKRLALPRVRLFTLADIEERFPELLRTKPTRSRVEYYFTCTPSVVRYVLEAAGNVHELTYVDADLYFFADPEPLFAELDAAAGAISIIPHRFPPRLKALEQFGIFNVGWITFRRDARALACLEDWQRRCIEWCSISPEPGRFGDQKYLDDWPERFAGVVVLSHVGANVALYNIEEARVAAENGGITIDGAPLLFYHYHGLKAVTPWLFRTSVSAFGSRLRGDARRLLYRPYLRAWREMAALVRALGVRAPLPVRRGGSLALWLRSRPRAARRLLLDLRRIPRGEFLIALPPSSGAVAAALAPERSGRAMAEHPS
jgi:hypothetical protein